MDTTRICKETDVDEDDMDDFDQYADEYERGSMSFPILKKRVWIAVSDFTKPEGYEWIPIDEWMPLAGLENFIDCKWIRYEDFKRIQDEEWIPIEDLTDIHDYEVQGDI